MVTNPLSLGCPMGKIAPHAPTLSVRQNKSDKALIGQIEH